MWQTRPVASQLQRLGGQLLRQQQQQQRSLSVPAEQTLAIIGVPFAKGQGKQGVELAPDLLRQNKLRQVLQNSDGE